MNSPQEFRRLSGAANRLRSSHGAGALATIVRTAGSTYRRAGTSMLVSADHDVVCPLAGGCPQNDLVLRALGTIADDVPRIACYNRDEGSDVLIESGCDGELEVLIEPLSREQDFRFLDAVASLHERRVCGFMATVYSRGGRVVSPRPERMIASGHVEWCDIPDGPLRDRIARIGHDLREGEHAAVQRLATHQGPVAVLFEPLQPAHRLVVFGVNAGALALAGSARSLGWECLLADPAPHRVVAGMEDARFVRANADAMRRSIAFDRYTSLVAMTHNLEQDIGCLHALSGVPLAYLGVIGSRERAARIRARLPVAMNLHAPAGLDIGSETPEEIALAVAAEILACLHARRADSLAASAAPIHP